MLSSSLVSSVEYDLTVARQLAYFFISYSPDGQDREVEPEQFFSDILHLSIAGATVSTTGGTSVSSSSAAPSLHSTAANAASQIRVTISNPVQRPRQGTCAVLIELTRPLTWLSHRGRPRGGAATTGSSGSGHGNSSSAAAVGGGGGEANTASGGPSVASTHPTTSAGDSAGGNTSGGGGGLGSSVSHPWNSSMAGSAASQAGGAPSRPAGGAARTSQPGGSHRAAPPPPPPSHAAATPASPALPLLVATATFEIIFPARYPHEGCQWLLSEEVALGGGGDRASSSWAVTGNHHRGGSSSGSGRSLAVSGVAASQHRRAGAWTGGAQPSVDSDTASHRPASTRLLAASAGDSGSRSSLAGGVGASPPQQHSSATGGDGPSASAPAEDATAHLTAFVVPRLGRRFLRWIAEARSHSTESSTSSSSPLSTHPPSRPSHSDASPFLMDFACLLRCWCALELDVHHLLLPPRVAVAYGGGGARLLRAMAGSHLSGGAVGGVGNAPPPPSGGAAGAVLSPSSSASASAAAAVAASSSTAAAAFSPTAATALSSGGVGSSAPTSAAAVTTASSHSGGAGGAHGAAFGAYGVKAAATGPAAALTSNNSSSSGGGGGVVTAAATAGVSAATVPALLSAPLVSSSSSGGGVGGGSGSGSGSGGAASGGVGGPTATSAGGGASALYPYRRRAVRHFLAVLLPDGRVAVCGSPPTAPTAHRRAAGHAIAKSTAAGPSTTAAATAAAGGGAVEGRLEKIPLCLLPLYEGAKGKKEGSDETTMNAARTNAATHNDPADKAPAASPRRFGVPGTLLGCTSQFTRGKLLPSFLLPTHVLGSPYKCEWGDLCLFTGKGADAALHANAKLAKALRLPHISDLLQVLRRLSRNVGTTTTGVVYISEVLWPTLVETVRVLRGSRLPFWAGVAVCALLLPSVLEQEERRHRIDQQDSSDGRRGGGAAQVSVVPVMPPAAAAAASTAALPTETTSGVPSTTPAAAAVAAAATSARPVRRWTQHIADLIQVVAYVERVLAIAKEYTLLCEARLVRCAMQRGLQMLVHEWQRTAAAGENGGGAVLSPAALPSLATVPPAPLEMCRRLHAPISVCAVCGLSLLRNTVKLDAATAAADARARTPASLSPEVERKGSELAMGRARMDAANNAAASVVGVLRSRRAEGCLVVQCARCGHGGHVEHMSSWWTDPTVHCCPKGCDCICEY